MSCRLCLFQLGTMSLNSLKCKTSYRYLSILLIEQDHGKDDLCFNQTIENAYLNPEINNVSYIYGLYYLSY